MELTIYWTQLAEDKLYDIFEYYKLKAGLNVAQKIVNGIIDASIKLEKSPYIGQQEELLITRVQEFRYLVYKRYKIIYWVNKLNNRIEIANVFDSRQDPIKIIET